MGASRSPHKKMRLFGCERITPKNKTGRITIRIYRSLLLSLGGFSHWNLRCKFSIDLERSQLRIPDPGFFWARGQVSNRPRLLIPEPRNSSFLIPNPECEGSPTHPLAETPSDKLSWSVLDWNWPISCSHVTATSWGCCMSSQDWNSDSKTIEIILIQKKFWNGPQSALEERRQGMTFSQNITPFLV